jgi:4-alpha-glucanotransferase
VGTDEWGIDDGWVDTQGRWQSASRGTVEAIRALMGDPSAGRPVWVVRPGADEPLHDRCRLVLEDGTDLGDVDRLPPDLPLGLHDLAPLDGGPVTTLLVGPGRCHLPDDLRAWGVVAQVPASRSARSWGIGDLADVRALAEWLRDLDGGFLALSPLHAPTPVAPIATSPYYPSSRQWRSPLLVRVDEVPGGHDPAVASLGAQARALLRAPLLDRDACWALQRQALELLWEHLDEAGRRAVAAWRSEQGAALEGWARYCALAEQHGPTWRRWPLELRHPDGPAVTRAASALAARIAFHAWLQLLVAQQLDLARAVGPRLVLDLAIGADPGGADAWLWQDLLADGFSIGAPPDDFAPDGQRWGIPPWIPGRLRDRGYRPLADLLRASLVAGGGLRIDHVMGLTRLFWVPEGGDPADGAYVRFAGTELHELVALESARAQAIVVGEDLGTVEPGLRDQLAAAGILSTRLAWFEPDPPEVWPRQALAMVTTHDLPTLAGMCLGVDRPAAMWERVEHLVDRPEDRPLGEVAEAIHRRLGASPCVLAAATLEDLCGVVDRPNRPGTLDGERPNWSIALPQPIEDLRADARAATVVQALGAGRHR